MFEAGEIFYCDDSNAFGHKSQSVGNQPRYSVFVEVEDSFDAGPCTQTLPPKTRNMGHLKDIPMCNDTVSAEMLALTQFI